MKDRSIGIWLIVMFGVSGLVILMLTWLWPTLVTDKPMATLAGVIGIAIAVIQALIIRHGSVAKNSEQLTVEVENES